MELTSALQPHAYDVNRPRTQQTTTRREYVSPPTHETQGLRKITLNDWTLHNNHLSTTGVKLRNDTIATASLAHETSDAIRLRTNRNQNITTENLGQRISHIERSQDNLNVANDLIDKEIQTLEQVKADTEKMLQDMSKPLEIAKQCLEIREQRRKTDSVRDKPEDELLKEVKLIERICGSLQNKIQGCFMQLNRLRSARAKVYSDLDDKNRAHTIDTHCKTLTGSKASYQYQYMNQQQNGLGSNPQSWARFSAHNMNTAQLERESSRQLREQAQNLQHASKCDLNAANNKVDTALRVRINEMEQAKNELSYNRREMLLEISHAEREIENLKNAIHDQVSPMQVAQTRYANRERRPNIELCHDHVESGIKSQIQTLNADISNLEYQLERVHERRKELRLTLARIEDELASKMLSLELDQQCLQLRSS